MFFKLYFNTCYDILKLLKHNLLYISVKGDLYYMNKTDNFNLNLSLSVKVVILILLIICILNGSKISDFIYSLNTEGFSEFEGMRTYISVQIILSILSILDTLLIAVDYYKVSKTS